MANPRKPLYDLVKDVEDRIGKVELGKYFMLKNGTIVWKSGSKAASSRWTQAIADALGTSVEGLSAMATLDGLTVNMRIPEQHKSISAALGNYFEYCFWDSCFKLASGDAQVTVEKGQRESRGNRLTYVDTITKTAGPVTATADASFAARGQQGSWIMEALKEEERRPIEVAAYSAAIAIISEVKSQIADDQNAEIRITAVAGSSTMGDVIVEALNGLGKSVIKSPVLELKYYASDNITWSTLSDVNFDMKFSSYLRQYQKKTDWNLEEDTGLWLSGLRTTGFSNYVKYLKSKHGGSNLGLFRYFLAKGGHQDDLAQKRAIIVNSNNGHVTITTDIAALANRIKRLELNSEGGVARFSRIDAVVGTFGFANPQDLATHSKTELNGNESPDWSTSFRFQLTKAFYRPTI